MSERLQKVLAQAGLGSRREIEDWISAGRVILNGNLATLGDCVTPGMRISVDGQVIHVKVEAELKRRVLALNKLEGTICTKKDPEGRPTVYRNLPTLRDGRWISVGRLDFNSSGLLLFTNDGDLANRLMHPSYRVKREYAVRVLGEVDGLILERLQKGVELDDGIAKFDALRVGGGTGANRWYHVDLYEGRNREVRRLWESQGVQVSRLIRVQYGTERLSRKLRPGKWQELDPQAVENLSELVGLVKKKKGKNNKRSHPNSREKMYNKSF